MGTMVFILWGKYNGIYLVAWVKEGDSTLPCQRDMWHSIHLVTLFATVIIWSVVFPPHPGFNPGGGLTTYAANTTDSGVKGT